MKHFLQNLKNKTIAAIAFSIILLLTPALADATGMSGTYTIGSGGNYTTFAAAVSALGTNGVSGAVTFNISAATYSESVSIGAISGASATNTITFQGAGRGNTFLTSPNSNPTIMLSLCSYVAFSGMAITNSNGGYAVYFYTTQYCGVTYSNVTGNTSNNCCYLVSTNFSVLNYDYIKGGSDALNCSNSSISGIGNLTCTNNRITGFSQYGIFESNSASYSTYNENFSNNVMDSSATGGGGTDIYIFYTNGLTMSNNKFIAAVSDGSDLYFLNCSTTSVTSKIYNNFWSNFTAYVNIEPNYGNCFVGQNTFYGDRLANGYPPGVLENFVSPYQIINNLFYSINGYQYGSGYYYSCATGSGCMIDGNDYYNTNGPLIDWNNTNYATISSFQTSFGNGISYTSPFSGSTSTLEHNGKNIQPTYVNPPTDIHFTPSAILPKGLPCSITTDIFGALRSTTTPTCGAVEGSGGYLNFSNGSEYITLNNTIGNVGTGDFTVQVSFRTSSSSHMYLVSKRSVCANDDYLSISVTGGDIELELSDGTHSTGFTSTGLSLADGNWHQVSMVRTNGILYLYVDGTEEDSKASLANESSTYITTLGKSPCNGANGSVNFNGDMDELRFWNRALCVSEINNNKSCELSGTQIGLLAYYQFDEGIASGNNSTITSLTDASGNSNTGTLHSFTLSGGTSNWISGGVSGTCGAFTSGTMAVTGITNGGSATAFAGIGLGNSETQTFTVTNTGPNALTFGTITFSGTNASDFTVTTQPSTVAVNSSTTFVIKFTPGANGARTATISIPSNDCFNSPYTFSLSGTGGVAAGALNFDGSGDYVEIPNSSTVNSYVSTGAATIEYWVNPARLQVGQDFITNRPNSNDAGFLMESNNSVNAVSHYFHTTAGWEFANVNYTANTWQHVAVTAKIGDSIKVYLNGVETASVKLYGTAFTASSNVTRLMANAFSTTLNNVGEGSLDEVRIWNRVLCKPEINATMNCELPNPASQTGLEAYYQFNEGYVNINNSTVTSLTDQSGNSNTGTLVGYSSQLTGSTSNWVAGAIANGTTCSTFNGSPAISAQPANATVCEGTNALFSVSASGTGLSYQWQLSTDNGSTFSSISGATASSYTISSPTPSSNGYQYIAIVSSSCGSSTSAAGILTVNPSTVITTQPSSVTVCAGTDAVFSVGAAGTGTLSYQWQLSTDNGSTFNTISNATASSYTVSAPGGTYNNYQYQAVVSGTCGTVTSNAGTLSVNSLTAATVNSLTICSGSDAVFTVIPTSIGSGALTYQWFVNPNGVGSFSSIAGANAATLTVTSPPPTVVNTSQSFDNNQYECVVTTNGCNSLTSNAGTLRIGLVSSATVVNQTACLGYGAGVMYVSSSISAGPVMLSYQWYVSQDGGANLSILTGATSYYYLLSDPPASANGYQYMCSVSIVGCPGVHSSLGTMEVNGITSATVASQTVCPGTNAVFSVSSTSSGSPSLSYQWQQSIDGGNTFSTISGATSVSYTVAAPGSSSNNYQYECLVTTSGCNSFTSTAGVLTVPSPMSGTYTIAASGANYASFTAAINDLNCRGISGAVTFNVASGTYNEAISIGAITGISATNTISFNGAGHSNTTLTSTNTSQTLLLTGSYVNFTGMTISNTNSSAVAAVYFNTATHCSVAHCFIITASASYVVDLNATNYCTFDHDEISSNGSLAGYGIYNIATTGGTSSNPIGNLQITNCRVTNFTTNGIYTGGSNYTSDNNLYANNVIDSSTGNAGIYTRLESGATVTGNMVIAKVSYPIYIYVPNYLPDLATQYKVTNNFCSNYTLYFYINMNDSYAQNVLLAHNTFWGNNNSGNPAGRLDFFNVPLQIFDNVFYSANANGVGAAEYLSRDGSYSNIMIDGNDYYAGSGALVYTGNSYTSLSSWKSFGSSYSYTSPYTRVSSTFDHTSYNILPSYVNPVPSTAGTTPDIHYTTGATPIPGLYAGITTDFYGTSRSATAPTAGAVENLCIAPVISASPSSLTVCSGSSASFSVTATGTGLSYQWSVSTDNGVSFSSIPGATSSSYTVSSTPGTSDNNQYEVSIGGQCGATTSNAAILRVNGISSATVNSNSVCSGTNAVFTVTPTSTGPAALTYQWYINPNGTGSFSAISGATAPSLTVATPIYSENNLYECVLSSNGCNAFTSGTGTLIVNTLVGATVNNNTACVGTGSLYIQVTPTIRLPGTLSYQWYLSTDHGTTSSAISGATSQGVAVSDPPASSDGSEYLCTVSLAGCNTLNSNYGILTVSGVTSATVSSQTTCSGYDAVFTVSPIGINMATLSYQWQLSTDGGSTFSTISGATSSSFTVSAPASSSNNNQYICLVTSGTCAAFISTAGTLTVNSAPAISTQPSSATICAGNNTSFSVTASGTSLTYQWQVNTGSGYNNVSGAVYTNATTAILNITGATAAMNGYAYQCIVSGACAPPATSGSAVLIVPGAMSGTYTIASSGANYTSFTAAINDLVCRGINGAVTFNVAAGTYTEAISIGAISGSSSTNTITFVGAGRSNTILTASATTTITMNGCSYVSFQQMGIVNSNSKNAVSILSSNNCSISYSNITTSSTAPEGVYLNSSGACTVSHSNIYGGNNAIGFYSGAHLASSIGNFNCLYNRITKFGSIGIDAYDSSGKGFTPNVYDHNVVDSGGNNSTGYSFRSYDEDGATISNNQFIAITCPFSISISEVNRNSSATQFSFVNNYCIAGTNSSDICLINSDFGSHILIAHNTFDNSHGAYNGLYMVTYQCTDVRILNNIFMAGYVGSAAAAALWLYDPSGISELNGNDYVVQNGDPLITTQAGASYYTLAALRSAFSSNSYTSPYDGHNYSFSSKDTVLGIHFTTTHDPHLNPSFGAPLGVYAGIATDIFNYSRSTTSPTAGAAEWQCTSPSVSASPSSVTVCSGRNATFSVTGAGSPTLTYLWQENKGAAWSNLSDGGIYSNTATSTLTLTAVTSAMNGYNYQCVVSGACSPAATSGAATLNVNTLPSITSSPSSSTVCPGSNTSFSVTATGTTLAYQWQVNSGSGYNNVSGAVYTNATTATLNITGATSAMSGYTYQCVVSGTCSPAATSNAATLTINIAPTISASPSSTTICAGNNTSFSVTASGTSLTYQWQVNTGSGYSNVSGAVYTNATTATLNISGATAAMNGYAYQCVVSGTCSPSATSSAAVLTVPGPMSGTYTIASSGANYASITSAINDLICRGISSAVTFNVSSGTYTEALTIPAITGASSTNTITFAGAGRGNSIITNSGSVITLNNSTYVTFNGFTITGTSSSNTIYANRSNNCSVLNCNINGGTGSINVYDNSTNYTTVSNCHISGGTTGVYVYFFATHGLYTHNRIVNFTQNGISSLESQLSEYSFNTVDSVSGSGATELAFQYDAGVTIKNNVLIGKAANAMYFAYLNFYTNTVGGQIINNFCANVLNGNTIFLVSDGSNATNVLFAHNTIYGTANSVTMSLALNYNTGSGLKFVDNIIYSSSNSYPAANFGGPASNTFAAVSMMDGNDYYNSGTGGLVKINNGTPYTSLSSYQSAMSSYTYTNPYNTSLTGIQFESSATNILPSFVNLATNFHFAAGSMIPFGVDAGITTDIYGTSRSASTPTAGAVEQTCTTPIFSACPSNITTGTSATTCSAVVAYTAVTAGYPVPTVTYAFSGATTGSGSGTGSGATFNNGVTTVTINASNTCGSATACSFTITVNDNTPPIAIAKDITISLNSAGTATIAASDIDNNSSDNCSIASETVSQSSFSCSSAAVNMYNNVNNGYVTLPNVSHSQNFTYEAWVNFVSTNPSGWQGIMTLDYNESNWIQFSTDANGYLRYQDEFGTYIPNGTHKVGDGTWHHVAVTYDGSTVKMYADGVLDASASASLTFNTGVHNMFIGADRAVSDFLNGALSDIRVWGVTRTQAQIQANMNNRLTGSETGLLQYLPMNEGSGNTTLHNLVSGASSGVFTNLPSTAWTTGPTVFGGTGTYNVTLTVKDAAGNTSTAISHVTIKDVTAPTVLTKNISVNVDANTTATITTAQIDNGSTDNCSIAGESLSQTTFSCSSAGANTVTLSATDPSGNTGTNTAIVTVNTPLMSVSGNGNGITAGSNTTSTTNGTNIGSTGQGVAIMQTYTIKNSGTNILTFGAISISGTNASDFTVSTHASSVAINGTASFFVTFNPTTTSSENATISIINGGCANNPYTFALSGTGLSPATGLNFSGSSNSVSINNTGLGNFGTSDFTVQVNVRYSTSSGMFAVSKRGICNPSNFWNIAFNGGHIYLETQDASYGTYITSAHAFNDGNWHQISMVRKNNTLTLYVDGATEASGYAPSNLNNNLNLTLGSNPCNYLGNGNIRFQGDMDELRIWSRALCVGEITNNQTCELGSGQTGLLAYYKFNEGFVNGNNGSVTSLTDASGSGYSGTLNSFTLSGSSSNWATGNATGTCGTFVNPVISLTGNSQPISNGQTTPSTSNATDFGSTTGATITKSYTISNTGNEALTVSTIGISGTNASNFSVSGISFPATVAANSTTTFNVTFTFSNSISVGYNVATVTVNNNDCNNPAYAFAIQAQLTCTTPVFTACPANITASTTGTTCNNNVTYNSVITGVPTPTVTYSFSGATSGSGSGNGSGSTFNKGVTNVTITATNVCNTVTCNFTITVNDNTAPTITPTNIDVYLDASGNATFAGSDIYSVSDNCGVASSDWSPKTFTCSSVGANTVTITASDVNGNNSIAISTVTVHDNIAPTIATTNIDVYLDANGNATFAGSDIYSVSDNCSVASSDWSPKSFTCSSVGANTVTITASDVNGNNSIATAIVTVHDNIAPIIIPTNIDVYLDASGNATFAGSDIYSVSDNCEVASSDWSPKSFTCSSVGANTVTITAGDVNGNNSTAYATVTVHDNIAPTITPTNIDVYLDASGNATFAGTDIYSVSDNCSVASSDWSPKSYTCSSVGANTVTITASDVNGNNSTATATVTVHDDIAPTITPTNIDVYLDASGNATFSGTDIYSVSDNCSVASSDWSPKSFTCSSVGANTVTITASDVNGNNSTATATVTVHDNIAPTITPTNIDVYLDASGNATFVGSDIYSVSDNCSVASSDWSPKSYTCSSVGANTVTITASDVNGNNSAATATVTVHDNIAPTITPTNIDVYLDASGNATFAGTDIYSVSDNCSVASSDWSPKSFTCSSIGANTVTITASDVNGNNSTATTTVTVHDKIKPTVITNSPTVYLDASGSASITAAGVNFGSYDNCHIAKISLDDSLFNCSNLGLTNTVTLTAVDQSGNSSSNTATVTVLDTARPVIHVQNVTVYLDPSGKASITCAMINNGTTDNCTVSSLMLDNKNFTCANLGSGNTVKLTATDESGNSNHGYATVTVLDTTRPIMHVQNVTVYLDAYGKASITTAMINNGTTDNCTVSSYALDNSNFTCANLGSGNIVKLTATDESSNSNHAYATVTVKDTTRPVVLTKNILITLNSSNVATIGVNDINNGSYDNCSIVSYSLSKTSFNCSNVNANTVTLYVTDNSGNVGKANAIVTVKDPTPPVARAKNITVYLDNTGNVTVKGTDVDNGSSDNCSIASYSVSPSAFSCSNLGWNKATLTVADAWGNTASATCYIDVIDNTAPVVKAKNVTVYLNTSGRATLSASSMDNGSSDNCGYVMAFDHDGDEWTPNSDDLYKNYSCSDIGNHSVTVYAVDKSNNYSGATVTVTVADTTRPVTFAKNINVYLGKNGSTTVSTWQIDNGSYDNCGIASESLSQSTFSCSNIGTTTVILSVKDNSGNVGTAKAIINVIDNTPPDADAQNITAYLNASGSVTITPAQVNNGSQDNCSIASMTLSQTTFTCSNIGYNTVMLTVKDPSGNASNAYASVYVVDTISPVLKVKNQTVYLDKNGNASVNIKNVVNSSSDNCSVETAFDRNGHQRHGHIGHHYCNQNEGQDTLMTYSCTDIGTNTLAVYAIDPSGNTTSANAIITVLDTMKPVLRLKNATAYIGSNGSVVINTGTIDNGSSDNCSIASETLSQTTFSCSNIGNNPVTVTIKDPSGNTAIGTAIVTVKDVTPPVAKAKNLTVYLDATGNASVTASQINNGSTDNCSIASESLSKTSFTCANVGNNAVTLTVTDPSGNSATANATVTVIDNIAPIAKAKNVTAYLNASGIATVYASQLDNGSSDNCGVVVAFDHDGDEWSNPNDDDMYINYSCSNIGTHSVTIYAIDKSNNYSAATATVTVLDTTRPLVKVNNISVSLNSSGSATINTNQINNGSYDNCSIASMSLSQTSFNCANVGPNTVTFTVKDPSGNVGTAKAIVTVNTSLSVNAGNMQKVYYGYTAAYNAATLSASASGGSGGSYSYKWSTGATTQSITVSPSSTTSYTVTAIDGNGCVATSSVQVVVIDVRCNLNGGSVLVCLKGNTYCLAASDVPAYLKKGAVLGSCDDDAMISQNQADLYGMTLSAYPNPFTQITTVSFTLSKDNMVSLVMYDLKGNKVNTIFAGDAEMNNIYTFNLQPAYLPAGVYMVRLTTPDDVKYIKIVKLEE